MSVFDFDDGDFIFTSGDTGFDSDGDMMMRMGDNMAMDMETGELHFTSGWDDDDYNGFSGMIDDDDDNGFIGMIDDDDNDGFIGMIGDDD